MTILQIIVLAIVQGITEFLPISSSGHLILVPAFTDWPDQGIMMDVGVHVGTLGAVIFFFRSKVGRMFHAFGQMLLLREEYNKEERHLMMAVVISTIPIVMIGGIAAELGLPDVLRTIEIIGWTSIIFGIFLYWFDKKIPVKFQMSDLRFGHALIIGLSQILSLIPGTSRSGVTMTAARALGFTRTSAARFSMLMSIPTILAAATLQLVLLFTSETEELTSIQDLIWGAGLSFISAYFAIAILMKWLERSTMTIFVIYRILLGIGLLMMVYM